MVGQRPARANSLRLKGGQTVTSAEWDFAIICGLVWVSALIWIIGDKLGTKLDVINHTLAQIEKRLSEIESA